MAGHNRWSQIKRKKGVTDAKRGKIWTRIVHEITVAVREGGGPDPEMNPRLRLAILKGKAANMPNDNIDRAIRRGSGEEKGEDVFETNYEGYGPGGVAVLIEVVTNNKNRTVGEIRSTFTKYGGNLGENGCVGWMFKKKGLIVVPLKEITEDALMEVALESGADDVANAGDVWEVTCDPTAFIAVKEAVEKKAPLELAEIQMLPSTRTALKGDQAEQMIKLLEILEELDDVINVYSNCDFE